MALHTCRQFAGSVLCRTRTRPAHKHGMPHVLPRTLGIFGIFSCKLHRTRPRRRPPCPHTSSMCISSTCKASMSQVAPTELTGPHSTLRATSGRRDAAHRSRPQIACAHHNDHGTAHTARCCAQMDEKATDEPTTAAWLKRNRTHCSADTGQTIGRRCTCVLHMETCTCMNGSGNEQARDPLGI